MPREKYTFPVTYGEGCVLVPIDAALIPIISAVLKPLSEQRLWATESDFELGYNAFVQLRADMQNDCVQQITDRLDNLYRLLDTSLNGTQYTAGDPDPVTGAIEIAPAIATVPPASTEAHNALRSHIGRIWMLLENEVHGATFPAGAGIEFAPPLEDGLSTRETLRAMQGIINAGWFGIGGQQATIADLIASLRLGSGDDKDQVLTALDGIVGAGSSATIFNTVRSFFTDSADLGLEGGQIAVQVVAAMGQIISNKLMSDQLERVLETLGGAGLIGPADSILQALRGDTPASAERNVIDAAGGAGQAAVLDELAADVEDIRVKVQ